MRTYSDVHDITSEIEVLYKNITGNGTFSAAERDIVYSSIIDAYTYAMMEYGIDNFHFKKVDISRNTIANVNFIDLDEYVYKVIPNSVRIPGEALTLGVIDETEIFRSDPEDVETGVPTAYAYMQKAGDTNSVDDTGTKVLHMKMNDDAESTTVTDASSTDNDGVLTGGDNTEDITADGAVNAALELDGSHYVAVSHNAGYCNAEGFSFAIWFYVLGEGTGDGYIAIKQGTAGSELVSWALIFKPDTNELVFGLTTDDNSYDEYTVTDFAPSVKTWYHFTATYESGSLKLYINGVLYRTITSLTDYVYQTTGNLNIGYEDAFSGQYFYGRVDDARIYNIALNTIQIARLYNDGDGSEDAAVEDVNPNMMRMRLWPTPDGVYEVKCKVLKFPSDTITNFPVHLVAAIKNKAKSLACLGLGLISHVTPFEFEYERFVKKVRSGLDDNLPKHVGRRILYRTLQNRLPGGSGGQSATTEHYTTVTVGAIQIFVENLAVGVDISSRLVYTSVRGISFTTATIITTAAPRGIDVDNTATITLKNASGSTIVSRQYDTDNQPPTSDSADLGTLSITSLAAGGKIYLTVEQNGTANLPGFQILLE